MPAFEWVDTPDVTPIDVPCVVWYQVRQPLDGSVRPPVHSAPCPKCQPNLKLPKQDELPRELPALLKVMQPMRLHLSDYGRVICQCGAHVRLVESK